MTNLTHASKKQLISFISAGPTLGQVNSKNFIRKEK